MLIFGLCFVLYALRKHNHTSAKLYNEETGTKELTDQNFLPHQVGEEGVGVEMRLVLLLPVLEAVGEEGVGDKTVHLSPAVTYRGTRRSCSWTEHQTSRSPRDLIQRGCCLLEKFVKIR